MITTAFTELVGCRVPIQSVPSPGICTPDFVASVCKAGGLGMLSGSLASPPIMAAELDAVAAATDAACGVNFLVPFIQDHAAIETAAQRARVVDFFFGEPDAALVELVHRGGALCGWQTGSKHEAKAAADAGCDFVIVQGQEAGGHVRGTAALLPILSATLDAVDIPVLGAGGIATGRDVAAVLSAGAAGCRIGTRLVCTRESNAHDRYKQLLVEAEAEQTTYTDTFSVMWPDAPHRVLQSAIDAVEATDDEMLGEGEISGMSMPVQRRSVLAPTRETSGNIEAMALYAGESVANIHSVDGVAEVIERLVADAAACLN